MADASAAFELEDESLSSGLDAVAAKFAAIATQINSGFAGANAQLTRTASSAQAIGTSTPAVSGFSRGLANAATTAHLITVGLSGVVMTVARLAPLVKFIPDSMARWVAPVKAAVAEHQKLISTISAVRGGVQAVTGRLTVLNSAFLAMSLHGAGLTKTMAAFGAAGALAASKTIAGMRGALAAVTALGGGVGRVAGRMTGLGGAVGAVGRHASTIGMVMSPMLGMALALGPVGAAAMSVAAGFGAVKKSIGAASEVQTLQTGFISLLGSADAARARMAELAKFAASTPFEIPQVVKASKVLETLTGGALSTGKGLEMVGDIASLTGQPFEELAVHVGRLHSGLMNGRPVGEAMQRLQELGVILPDTRSKLEDLQKSGAKGGDVWSVAAKDLMRFGGEMKRQSNTWSGVMSNISDSIGQIFTAFGAPIISDITPFMIKLQTWLQSLVAWAARAGQIFAAWSATLAQVFTDGNLGKALFLVGKIALIDAANAYVAHMIASGAAWGRLIVNIASKAGEMFAAIFSNVAAGFGALLKAAAFNFGATILEAWSRFVSIGPAQMGDALTSAIMTAGKAFNDLLFAGIKAALEAMKALPGLASRAGAALWSVQKKQAEMATAVGAAMTPKGSASLASSWRKQGAEQSQIADAKFSNAQDAIRNPFAGAMDGVMEAFEIAFRNAPQLFDSSADKAEVMKMFRDGWAEAQNKIAATAKLAEQGGLPAPVPGTADASAGDNKDKVSALQKIGLGGGSGPRDPVVAATNAVRAAVEKVAAGVEKVEKAVAARRPGTPLAVFA